MSKTDIVKTSVGEPKPVPFQVNDSDTTYIRVEWGGRFQDIYIAPARKKDKAEKIEYILRLVKKSLINLSPAPVNREKSE